MERHACLVLALLCLGCFAADSTKIELEEVDMQGSGEKTKLEERDMQVSAEKKKFELKIKKVTIEVSKLNNKFVGLFRLF